MNNFIKTALGSFRTSGTIRPSSPSLIRKMLVNIDFDRDITILEFGAGDGVVTLEIAKRLGPASKLYSFEINPEFYSMAKEQIADHPNVQMLPVSAFEVKRQIEMRDIGEVDYIVSCLPISFFKDAVARPYLEDCYDVLTDEGKFIQFQYSLSRYKLLRKVFESVKLSYTLRNLPPAFIYTCTKRLQKMK